MTRSAPTAGRWSTRFDKAAAFVAKDFLVESSYKLAFVMEIVSSLVPILPFYFLGRAIRADNAAFAAYEGGYFGFAMVGVAVSGYFALALHTFAGHVRRAQTAGCLEAILSTRTRPGTFIVLSSLYVFLSKLLHVAIALTAGMLLAGIGAAPGRLLAFVAVILLSVAAFGGLGILSAAVTVAVKRGDPILWAVTAGNALLGGAVFPVAVMPGWLRVASQLVPMKHALCAARIVLLTERPLLSVWREACVLAATAAVLLPVGIVAFEKAVHDCRRRGTLGHY